MTAIYFEKIEVMGVNASKYVEGRKMDILEQIKARHQGAAIGTDDMLDAAGEEIKLLRERLKGLRQKLAELGADTDLT